MTETAATTATHPTDDDAALVQRILQGDAIAFERLMRLHNAALFRAARGVLRDDAEAEDALQEAYLSAFRNIGSFRGDARLATWLTRIVINHSLGRLRSRRRGQVIELADDRGEGMPAPLDEAVADEAASPEAAAGRAQLRRLLEREIDVLPLAFRTAFVLREVEGLSMEETAHCLSIPEATVRTRVFRARALLRAALSEALDIAASDVFRFAGARCDRIVAGVLCRLVAGNGPDDTDV